MDNSPFNSQLKINFKHQFRNKILSWKINHVDFTNFKLYQIEAKFKSQLSKRLVL